MHSRHEHLGADLEMMRAPPKTAHKIPFQQQQPCRAGGRSCASGACARDPETGMMRSSVQYFSSSAPQPLHKDGRQALTYFLRVLCKQIDHFLSLSLPTPVLNVYVCPVPDSPLDIAASPYSSPAESQSPELLVVATPQNINQQGSSKSGRIGPS